MKAMIALEDGRIFEGFAFGAEGEAYGEIVFNTSMTGYQEILTDPSYKGQIVTMTYPLIGNYGINDEDSESEQPQAAGFVVKEYSRIYSNWRAKKSLGEYLEEHDIIAIEGVDTRALTKHIRTCGAMRSIISTVDLDKESLIAKAKASPGLIGRDLVKEVTCEKIRNSRFEIRDSRFNVVAMDFGIKYNILKMLADAGCNVTVVPASTDASSILALNPDGVFLSNGPGDPEGVPYAVETVKNLIHRSPITNHRLPIFGICLGHQILGLAFGGKTYKLKFGHRGGNQPVKDLSCGKIDITSQNHGFCVDINSLNQGEVEITHINANDQTIEGMQHKSLPIFSVQYHPEASPGPHDAGYLFDRFVEMMRKGQ
ncbi:glutamine-hydrolyzing carbamoyl-phosphate synthase small subunit [Candidatus Desantisbacteria bacterium]|nr:glutamine-hydrolyzing carbamoyl-phosphate synthase small subunit [Candidatus Desantisbacteria bacterium]